MPIKDLKNWLPKPEQIQGKQGLGFLKPYLSDARLWHFNRFSIVRAIYIGVMCSFLPLPGQMLMATICCLYFRANIPMAVALTWITNPITTIPIYYLCYLVGAFLMSEPAITLEIIGDILSATSSWIFSDGSNPLYLFKDNFSWSVFGVGLVASSLVTSAIAGIAFDFFWRYKTISLWKKRAGYRTPKQLEEIKKQKALK